MSIRFAEGGRDRVLRQGLALSGLESAPPQAETLLDTLVYSAAALCGRRDIPRAMEGALAVLLARSYQEGLGRSVSTVKRGDTAITYASGQPSMQSLLQPFMRLHTPGRRRKWYD